MLFSSLEGSTGFSTGSKKLTEAERMGQRLGKAAESAGAEHQLSALALFHGASLWVVIWLFSYLPFPSGRRLYVCKLLVMKLVLRALT